MASRNPSKQRRQSQNRAAREARAARSTAANTPVTERRIRTTEEPAKDRRSRRRRSGRKTREEVAAEARTVIDSSAVEEEFEDEYEDDEDAEFEDDLDGDVGEDSSSTSAPAPASNRRNSSPVFSARHRAEVAATTGDRTPARTHSGVVSATGLTPAGPASFEPPARSNRVRPERSSSSPATRSRPASGSPSSSKARPAPAPKQPPGRPLPAALDRFGGNEPGGRWVMLSFVTILIASVALNFVDIVPEIVTDANGDQVRTGDYHDIWHYGIGPGLVFLLPPIVVMGLFIATARPWDRRRSWNYALALLAFSTIITSSISIYIIPLGLLALGCWQARKAALAEVGGDPRVLREVERERRIEAKEALRARRSEGRGS